MIMRKIRLIFVLIVLFLTAPAFCADVIDFKIPQKDVFISSENFKWRILKSNMPEQEELKFDIYWKFIKVGHATLEIKGLEQINGRSAYHLYSQARSAAFFDNFFKVRDVNESWMDKESLCSLRYRFDVSEGGWKKKEQADFDHIKKEFILDDNGTIKTGNITLWVQDIISAFYYFRTLDLEAGDEYIFDVHSGDKTWPLKTKVTGREKIEVKAGKFDCFILEPAVRENAGIFQAKGKLKVWITADDKKMPVMMKTKTPFGSVNAELSSYSTPSEKQTENNSEQKKEEQEETAKQDKETVNSVKN